MTLSPFELLGISGFLIVSVSIMLQVVKTYRTKRADDLSITYLTVLMIGTLILMIYAFHIKNAVFVFGYSLSILSISALICLWCIYRFRRRSWIIKR
jgi:MtN3 and saliva related transmembrane protein